MNKHLKYFKEDEQIVKILVEGFNHTFKMTETLTSISTVKAQKSFREVSHYYGLIVDKKSPMSLLKGESPRSTPNRIVFVVLQDMLKGMSDYKALKKIFTLLRYFLKSSDLSWISFYSNRGKRVYNTLKYNNGLELILEELNARNKGKDYNTLLVHLYENRPFIDMCVNAYLKTDSPVLIKNFKEKLDARVNIAKLAYKEGHRPKEEDYMALLGLDKKDWNNKKAQGTINETFCLLLLEHLKGKQKSLDIKNTLKYLKLILEFLEEKEVIEQFTKELEAGKRLTDTDNTEYGVLVKNYNSLILEGKHYEK